MKKLIAITGLALMSVIAMAQDVTFDYDRSANFGAYRTYQWVQAAGGQAPNQLTDQNIKRAVDSQLALKGLQRVESGADLHIAYQAAIDEEKQFSAWGTGPRFAGTGTVTSSTIQVGKLVVDMFDPAKNQLVWRGQAEKTLDIKKDPEKNYQKLQKAVAKMLKNYPPGSDK